MFLSKTLFSLVVGDNEHADFTYEQPSGIPLDLVKTFLPAVLLYALFLRRQEKKKIVLRTETNFYIHVNLNYGPISLALHEISFYRLVAN